MSTGPASPASPAPPPTSLSVLGMVHADALALLSKMESAGASLEGDAAVAWMKLRNGLAPIITSIGAMASPKLMTAEDKFRAFLVAEGAVLLDQLLAAALTGAEVKIVAAGAAAVAAV